MRIVLVSLLLIAAAVRAQGPEVLGWSPDGAYVALVEHGMGEGSGFPWAKLTILSTAKGKPVVAPTRVDLSNGGATEDDAVAQMKKKAEAERKRLKIAKWVPGRTIATNERGDLTDRSGAPIGTPKITASPANSRQQARACEEPFFAQRIKFEVYFTGDQNPFVALDEKRTPTERACVTQCKLGPVFAQAKAAVFLLACGIQGFEGTATSYYPIAAKLPYALDADLPSK